MNTLSTAPQRRTVLILGTLGRLGLAAAQAFDAAGWQVLAQVRREGAAGLPAGARVLRQSPTELLQQAGTLGQVDAVLHAINPPYTRWATDALPLMRSAMDLAQALDARLLFPGNVYNFGSHMPERLLPDTPQRADTRKGQWRVAMEASARQRCEAGQLRATVLRSGDFFGSGRGSWFDLVMAKGVRRGKLIYPGPLDRTHAWAYLPDLARAFVAVAEAGESNAFACHHFPGYTLTGQQWLAAVQSAAQDLKLAPRAPWRLGKLPWYIIRLGGWIWPMWRELAEMAYLWERPHRLAAANDQALTLALAATTPLNQALQASMLALWPEAGPPTLAPGQPQVSASP